MTSNSSASNIKAEAGAETVEDLVRLVRKGQVRLPEFQRELRWEADDVVQFFDSLYRGYPVGALLLSRGKAEAKRFKVGPLTIDAPETTSALWVVDGQQRLAALTVGLTRPLPVPTTPDDPWVVYFDSEDRTFREPPRDSNIPATWVPIRQLLDATALSEWVHNWTYSSDPTLRTAVFEAGARLRQYRIPLYIVDTNLQEPLRQIFHRINTSGKEMKWEEVHDALYGHSGKHPSTLKELATELQKLGMGRPEEEQLLSCLLAFKGVDVTRNLNWHSRKDQKILTNAVQDAIHPIRAALSFLRIHAEVPHLRLLPKSTPLPVLTRFFTLYPEPSSRTVSLLTRWTWRTLLGAFRFNERTLLRRAVNAIKRDDEEGSVQNLINMLVSTPTSDFALPNQFDARAADSRIALLGLVSLRPLSLDNGAPVDVAQLIDEGHPFRRIVHSNFAPARSPANRILLQGDGQARRELEQMHLDPKIDVLRSHGISPEGFQELIANRLEGFLEQRQKTIETAVVALTTRLAAWNQSDRPSIDYLLKQSDGDE